MNLSLTDLASIATAVGVCLTAAQLWLARKQAVTNFEDEFGREYRKLAAELPIKALLGEELDEKEYAEHFDEFYHYIDLCNEQVFHHQHGRITPSTWEFWRVGITHNLARPAFRRAWNEIAARSDSDFKELRSLFPPERPSKNS